jgi:hypothetical protein
MSETKDFEVLRESLLYIQVCSSLTRKQTEQRLNSERPPGTSLNRWVLDDETLSTGEPNPCACHEHPDTHRHWLFHC